MSETLDKAVSIGDLEQVKLLIKEINIDLVYQWACKEGNIAIVKYLLSNGINIHDYTDAGLWCAQSKDSTLLKYLLSQGLTVINPDEIMYIAAKSGNTQIMEYIISTGMVYNEKKLIERTIRKSNLDTIKYFFSKGLNIHINNEKLLKEIILDIHLNIHNPSEATILKINRLIDLIIFLIDKQTNLPEVLNKLEGKIEPIIKAILLKYYKNNTRLFIGELRVPVECGICLQEMVQTNELVQCKICKNCTHLECYREWSQKCIYCRN